MAFDFPTAPIVGTTYTSAGVTYAWTGTTWDIEADGAAPLDAYTKVESDAKFVDVTGDTMTGNLAITGNTTGVNLDLSGGLGFGSFAQPAGSEANVTRHISLYGDTFGFSVSSGTLNYIVPSANFHVFRHGTAQTVKIGSSAIDFSTHMNIGTAAALRNTSLHGYLLITDDQQVYLDGPGPVNTSSKGILLRKSATESAILHGRICSRSDDYSQGIIEFQLNNQANGVVGSVFFNGGLAQERWANFSAMSVQCNDVFETSTAADKTDIRDVQKAEVDTAWKTLKPKKFRRKYAEDNTTGPLRYGFVMEDMADELTKKRPPRETQGNTSGYSIGQVLALTVARLKEVEAELAEIKSKMK